MKRLTYLSAVLLGLLMAVGDAPAQNAASASSAKPTIVLVHCAFADALGWQYVIPILEKDGVKASHVAFISQPNTVARFIEQAAMGASK
ncbi:MAG TPA: hypothetical protein VF962_14260 [Gemmatimonadaceae bacterium]